MLERGRVVAHFECQLATRDEGRRLVAWDNVLLEGADGRAAGMASVGQDVTERAALEARLAVLSENDELTGLLDRRGFRRLAGHELKSAARTGRRDAVLYVDLDRFKPINDTYGLRRVTMRSAPSRKSSAARSAARTSPPASAATSSRSTPWGFARAKGRSCRRGGAPTSPRTTPMPRPPAGRSP
jgi:hypothetical protein